MNYLILGTVNVCRLKYLQENNNPVQLFDAPLLTFRKNAYHEDNS